MISSCVILSRPAELWEMLSKLGCVYRGRARSVQQVAKVGNWRVNQHFFALKIGHMDKGGEELESVMPGQPYQSLGFLLTSRAMCERTGHVCGTAGFPDPNIYHPYLPPPHILYRWRANVTVSRSPPVSSTWGGGADTGIRSYQHLRAGW